MSFSAISSRSAVSAAIAEFDSLGRDAFLEKYGFGPAKSYFLVANGLEYDSKAIVGAAHGFQFPHLGPLSCTEFSGGMATVVPLLRRLGFEIRAGGSDVAIGPHGRS
jgi:hypothetical protein